MRPNGVHWDKTALFLALRLVTGPRDAHATVVGSTPMRDGNPNRIEMRFSRSLDSLSEISEFLTGFFARQWPSPILVDGLVTLHESVVRTLPG